MTLALFRVAAKPDNQIIYGFTIYWYLLFLAGMIV